MGRARAVRLHERYSNLDGRRHAPLRPREGDGRARSLRDGRVRALCGGARPECAGRRLLRRAPLGRTGARVAVLHRPEARPRVPRARRRDGRAQRLADALVCLRLAADGGARGRHHESLPHRGADRARDGPRGRAVGDSDGVGHGLGRKHRDSAARVQRLAHTGSVRTGRDVADALGRRRVAVRLHVHGVGAGRGAPPPRARERRRPRLRIGRARHDRERPAQGPRRRGGHARGSLCGRRARRGHRRAGRGYVRVVVEHPQRRRRRRASALRGACRRHRRKRHGRGYAPARRTSTEGL